MARNTTLYLRIGEAKALPAKDLVSGTSDPYCVIKVDNEEVARTSTIWRTLTPFWGEEYTLYLPNGFHNVSIYVYDEDVLSGDDRIGSLTLEKAAIARDPKGIEQWFPLHQVHKDDEVKGEIHLELAGCTFTDRQVIKVKVIEARDLAVKDSTGTSDPYVVLSVQDQTQHTQTVKGSCYPSWDEHFDFELPAFCDPTDPGPVLTVTVWDWDRVGEDDYMGQIEFRVNDLCSGHSFNQWFHLESSTNVCRSTSKQFDKQRVRKNSRGGSEDHSEETFGAIRVRARLQEERILPTQYYTPLIQVLMDSVSPDKHRIRAPTPLKMLQEVVTLDLIELANTLVKLYLGQGKVTTYLDVITTEEIFNTTNPNTLFRGNSLATKSVDQFMKIVGIPYLHETLGPVIAQIFKERKQCELDPSRVDWARKKQASSPRPQRERVVVERSTRALIQYLTAIRDQILGSVHRMPLLMREMFRMLRVRIEQHWPGPEHEDHKYVGVSGFLFLRFLAPAILAPKLFHLQNQHPDARISRTLTLLAKALQSMGNLGLQLGVGKEQWMTPLHSTIRESVGLIKAFIIDLTQIHDQHGVECSLQQRSAFHPATTLKQGFLCKRRWRHDPDAAAGAPKWSLRALRPFKTRYFWLRPDGLVYAKKPTDQVRTTVLTTHICAVERVDQRTFNRSNVGQVIYKDAHDHLEVLYVQAKDVNDLNSWLSSVRKMVLTNSSLLDTFHPGTYKHHNWTCCLKPAHTAPGCSKTHSKATLGDWRDPLDPDVEAQIIYSQLLLARPLLRKKNQEIKTAVKQSLTFPDLTSEASPGGGEHVPNSHTLPSDLQLRLDTSSFPQNSNMLHSNAPTPRRASTPGSRSSDPQTPPSPPPPSPSFLRPTQTAGDYGNEDSLTFRKSASFQDAEIGATAQLLEVVRDLEKVHLVFEKMEGEERHLHSVIPCTSQQRSASSRKTSEPRAPRSPVRSQPDVVPTVSGRQGGSPRGVGRGQADQEGEVTGGPVCRRGARRREVSRDSQGRAAEGGGGTTIDLLEIKCHIPTINVQLTVDDTDHES